MSAPEHPQPTPETVVPLDAPFIDERGEIQPLLSHPAGSVAVIRTNKGAVRANHYHKTDWHYCYVLSGSIEYFHRPTGSNQPPQEVVVKQGQMFFTPPMVDHAMKFPEDTVFVVMSRNQREHDGYESDVVRTRLV